MTRKQPIEALVAAFGIIASTAIAIPVARAGALAFAAPLLLAASLIAADVVGSWRRGSPMRPSVVALVASIALVAACAIVISRDPSLVVVILPIVGAGSAALVLNRFIRRQ